MKARREWSRWGRLAALLALAVLLFAMATAETDGIVRVLLTRLNVGRQLNFVIHEGYLLEADGVWQLDAGTEVSTTLTEDGIIVSFNDTTVNCGSQAFFHRLLETSYIHAVEADVSYSGDLLIRAENGALLPVLRIDIENYALGTLIGSMRADDPEEALKAQAIAARSYALSARANAVAAKYDLTDVEGGMTFTSGEATAQQLKAAKATQGEVLWLDAAAARCVSCESNGGKAGTLSGDSVREDPYDIERAYVSPQTAVIRRDASNLNSDLKACLIEGMSEQLGDWRLSTEEKDIAILQIEKIERLDSEQLALRFTMEVRSTNFSSGKPVRCTVTSDVPVHDGIEAWYGFSPVASNDDVRITSDREAFSIGFASDADRIGLSRSGARARAWSNQKCAEILAFYFPEATIRRIALTTADVWKEESPYALPKLQIRETEAAAEASEPEPTVEPTFETTMEPTAEPTLEANVEPTPKPRTLTILTPEPDPEEDGWSADFLPEGQDADEIPLPIEWSEDFEFEDDFESGDDFEGADVLEDNLPDEAETIPGEAEIDSLPMDSYAETSAPEEAYRYVNVEVGSRLSLREEPSTESERLMFIQRGARVRLLDISDAWAHIETEDGKRGYVSVEYLSDTELETPDPLAEFRKISGNVRERDCSAKTTAVVNMRKEPNTDCEILQKVKKGKKVKVIGENDSWAYVTYNNQTGYIKKSYLKFIE